jgi:Secretion system C-terminal sorting domain
LGSAFGKDINLRLVDLQGRIVLTRLITQAENQINVENLKPGFYIYDIRQGNESLSKGKLSIKH